MSQKSQAALIASIWGRQPTSARARNSSTYKSNRVDGYVSPIDAENEHINNMSSARGSTDTYVKHPTKGWRKISFKRAKAEQIVAFIKRGLAGRRSDGSLGIDTAAIQRLLTPPKFPGVLA
jgi:hypothetical protein